MKYKAFHAVLPPSQSLTLQKLLSSDDIPDSPDIFLMLSSPSSFPFHTNFDHCHAHFSIFPSEIIYSQENCTHYSDCVKALRLDTLKILHI